MWPATRLEEGEDEKGVRRRKGLFSADGGGGVVSLFLKSQVGGSRLGLPFQRERKAVVTTTAHLQWKRNSTTSVEGRGEGDEGIKTVFPMATIKSSSSAPHTFILVENWNWAVERKCSGRDNRKRAFPFFLNPVAAAAQALLPLSASFLSSSLLQFPQIQDT